MLNDRFSNSGSSETESRTNDVHYLKPLYQAEEQFLWSGAKQEHIQIL